MTLTAPFMLTSSPSCLHYLDCWRAVNGVEFSEEASKMFEAGNDVGHEDGGEETESGHQARHDAA